jgi:hypothetical protein
MKKQFRAVVVGLGVLALTVSSGTCGTIFQSGGSGTTYTDVLGDGQGSANLLRDISFATISNDANNLYITFGINPAGNLASGGNFNYIMGITSGNPTAGGDTSANGTTHGNAYHRAISFDSSFGGMTDFIGIFGAGGSGVATNPFTSYGFNDFVFGTPGSGTPSGIWTNIETVAGGEPLNGANNAVTITVPLSDFAANLSLTPGSTFDFDIMSTGTAAGQTAYDSLAVQGNIQATFNSTFQYNATVLDQYTITSVPEPATLAMAGLGGLALALLRRARK